SEFIDRLGATVGCIEIARAVESQALVSLQKIVPRRTWNSAENKPLSVRCELEDGAGPCGTRIICRHHIDIVCKVNGEACKEKISGTASGTDVVTQVKFPHFPNFNRAGHVGGCRKEVADAVKGQTSRVI